MSRCEAQPFCWHKTEGNAGTLPPDGGVTLCRKRSLRTSAQERLRLWVDTARSRKNGSNSLVDTSAKNIECKLVQPLRKAVRRFLKPKIELPYDAAISLLGIYLEKTNSKRYKHPGVHCSTVYNSQGMEAT